LDLDTLLSAVKKRGVEARAAAREQAHKREREEKEAAEQAAAAEEAARVAKLLREEQKQLRQKHILSAASKIAVGKVSVMDVKREYMEQFGVKFCPKVLSRNADSIAKGNGLAHSGPRRLFEPAEAAQIREQQVERALRKDAVKEPEVPRELQKLRLEVQQSRVIEKGGAEGDVPGHALRPLGKMSLLKYSPLLLGNKRKAYSQNVARATAISDLYNPLSFVVALRLMYGFYFNDQRAGKNKLCSFSYIVCLSVNLSYFVEFVIN